MKETNSMQDKLVHAKLPWKNTKPGQRIRVDVNTEQITHVIKEG